MSLLVISPQFTHSFLWEAFSKHPYDLYSIIDPQHDSLDVQEFSHVWVLHHPVQLPLTTLNFKFDPKVRLFEESLEDKETWEVAQWDDHLGGYGFFFPKKTNEGTAAERKLTHPPSDSHSSAPSSASSDFDWAHMKLMDEEEHQEQIKQQLSVPAIANVKSPPVSSEIGKLQLEGQPITPILDTHLTANVLPIDSTAPSSSLLSDPSPQDPNPPESDPHLENEKDSYSLGPFILVHGKIGGPHGVRTFLRQLPPSLPCPVLVYQDLAPHQSQGFLEQMKKICPLPLSWIQPETTLRGGQVYLCQPEHLIQPYGDEYYVIESATRAMPQEEIELLAEQQGILVLLSGLPMTILMPCIQAIHQGAKVIAPTDDELLDHQLHTQLDGYGLERLEHFTAFLLEQFPTDPAVKAA